MKTIGNTVLVVVSLLISLVFSEFVLRLTFLNEPLTDRNFAADPVDVLLSKQDILHDPLLGYSLKPGWEGTMMGMRVAPPNGDRPGGKLADATVNIPDEAIIVVGDSFVFGSEVRGDQSWPWYFERLMATPVVNGGVGGYGFDQAYLRAVQLTDRIRPLALIVSCIPNCVGRTEYEINGGLPKPHFDVSADGSVSLSSLPVPFYKPGNKHAGVWRFWLGHSYLIYWVSERLGLSNWWVITAYEYRNAHHNGPEVSCHVMSRLSDLGARFSVPTFLVMEYSGLQSSGLDPTREGSKIDDLVACAKATGVNVVDTYSEFNAELDVDEKRFWSSWVRHPGDKPPQSTGHMTGAGNLKVACMVANAMQTVDEEMFHDAQHNKPRQCTSQVNSEQTQ